jgi:hypothetical protein
MRTLIEEVVMKKLAIIFAFLFIFISIIHAQTVIENPEKPTSKKAGRIIELKEEMSIDDIGVDYYFKYTRNPKVAPDGTLFISDHEQLLQFDQDGNFLRNYFKKGQGPEEMESVSNYFFSDNNIIVHDRRLQKILWFSLNGKYIKEFRIHELPTFTMLYHFYNNTFYFVGNRIPSTDGKASVINVPYDLISATEGGQEIEKLTSFPVESFAISSGGGGAMASIAELITAPYKEKYLVVCHTQEYQLKIYDVESKKTIRSFRRKYKRVKVPQGRRVGGAIGVGGKTYRPPRTYLNDIIKIFVFKELLWIMTSTTDEKKGVLIDVFDFEGHYIDNFYLKIPGKIDSVYIGYTPMTLSEDLLYMRVRNEDETISIKKYRMEDKGSK